MCHTFDVFISDCIISQLFLPFMQLLWACIIEVLLYVILISIFQISSGGSEWTFHIFFIQVDKNVTDFLLQKS